MQTRGKLIQTMLLVALTSLGFARISAEPLVKPGQTIAFLGDSITQQGNSNSGYVRLVERGLAANDIKVKVIPAGISGNESKHMLARLQKHVLDKKPDWMTLSCGVNDVWHQPRGGVDLPNYKKNITEIVDRCQKAGVKVVIMTSTPIMEKENDRNKMLAGYNDFLRTLAKERNLPLADLGADMWAELKNPTQPRPKGNFLTADGVHMNPLGDEIMATGILRAFGLNDDQIKKAKDAWLKRKSVRVIGATIITLEDYKRLAAIAAKEKTSVSGVLSKALKETVEKTLNKNEKGAP